MGGRRVTRREALIAGAAVGAAGALQRAPLAGAAGTRWTRALDFSKLGDGDGWPGWTCVGVANVRRSGGAGLLEAGSDVYPCDPRPVAFAVDQRFSHGEVNALVNSGGAGVGLVVRRTSPTDYYAAVLDDEQHALILLRRSGMSVTELARASVAPFRGAFRFTLGAQGTAPTTLAATVAPTVGLATAVTAKDGAAALQRAGDPGVLATARTLFPSAGPSAEPALGNIHLLPYGVQEGEAFMQTAVGQQVLDTIRERSTGSFAQITVSGDGPSPGLTRPSVVAATTGAPIAHGAKLRVASDIRARVEIEYAHNRAFRHRRRIRVGLTDDFNAALTHLSHLEPGRPVYWRPRLIRRKRVTIGPTRRFRPLPAHPGGRTTLAIAACASQFGPIFGHLAERRPDLFIWQGDLNYPDTIGPLAQSVPGYAGIWRDFMNNPAMSAIFENSMFAAQRDDHDYAIQDANSTDIPPWGVTPWEGLIDDRIHYSFSAGIADVWVLDQRRYKTDPTRPDTLDKTLLGESQREWFMKTLAASHAPFKIICSPCTVAPVSGNARDGSWAKGFTAERDLILNHIHDRVDGQTLFVTGDTHWTMVYDRDGLFEARPCPLGIPTPNDITLTSPNAASDARKQPGVVYADDTKGHFALVELSATKGTAHLDLSFIREDGAVPFKRSFEAPARSK